MRCKHCLQEFIPTDHKHWQKYCSSNCQKGAKLLRRKQLIREKTGRLYCLNCNKRLERGIKYCNRTCQQQFYALGKKPCELCGTIFKLNAYGRRKYCTPKCSRASRYKKKLEKMGYGVTLLLPIVQ